MGLHPSLKRAEKMAASRSVMKRAERIKWLKEHDQWEEKKGVLGLPKIKVVKLKAAKKEKKEEKPTAAGEVTPATGTTGTTTTKAAESTKGAKK